jgi:hypothetical protein
MLHLPSVPSTQHIAPLRKLQWNLNCVSEKF